MLQTVEVLGVLWEIHVHKLTFGTWCINIYFERWVSVMLKAFISQDTSSHIATLQDMLHVVLYKLPLHMISSISINP